MVPEYIMVMISSRLPSSLPVEAALTNFLGYGEVLGLEFYALVYISNPVRSREESGTNIIKGQEARQS